MGTNIARLVLENQVMRQWSAHNILLLWGWSGFRLGFSCLLREDNVVWSVGERIEPSRSQRPGFPSLPLPRQRFEEINTLASAMLQDEDWINYRLHWAAAQSHGPALKKSIDTPSILHPQEDWILSNSISKESSLSTISPPYISFIFMLMQKINKYVLFETCQNSFQVFPGLASNSLLGFRFWVKENVWLDRLNRICV